ncbi:MAG: hypothetical protein EBX40_06630 [Gammaproteobacteria bacterium]|nr:hypothetical protein [Gammaproteobacteria bacterium]
MGQKLTDRTELTSIASGDIIHVVDVSDTTDSAGGTSKKITQDNLIPDASATVKGKVELATSAETITGTDATRAVTPAGAAAAYQPLDSDLSALAAHPTYNLSLSIAPLNAPEGFLINGKIVPSVASNNLTVALKGLDGNDPSATNPVYCRINGVVRTITAALSVTLAAGTNWMNLGSAGLATKEVDLFPKLGYNATDGVVLAFSRFPGGNQYDDWSTTSTNEKYMAVSTRTNAAATDYYEVIGRFAATLSAGAGYTWTVPTYTAKNLIQRPIFETRLLNWTPATTASAGTFTTTSLNVANYLIRGRMLFIETDIIGTTSGTPQNLRASLPFTPSADCHGSGYTTDNGTAQAGHPIMTNSGYIAQYKYAFGNYAATTGQALRCTGWVTI